MAPCTPQPCSDRGLRASFSLHRWALIACTLSAWVGLGACGDPHVNEEMKTPSYQDAGVTIQDAAIIDAGTDAGVDPGIPVLPPLPEPDWDAIDCNGVGRVHQDNPVPSKHVKVLLITFNPHEGAPSVVDRYFFDAFAQFNPKPVNAYQFADALVKRTIEDFYCASEGMLHFHVTQIHDVRTFPTYSNGFTYTLNSYGTCLSGTDEQKQACLERRDLLNFPKWLTEQKVCERAEAADADEIWLMSPPFLANGEAMMIGPTPGFFVNGPSYVLPQCKKHYISVNPTYDRPEEFLHSYGHRVESTMEYLTSVWKEEDRQTYWRDFSRFGSPTEIKPYCGNIHYPTNTLMEYGYGVNAAATSTCPDWQNFPNLAATAETMSCSKWGCTGRGWYVYWFSALPRHDGMAALVAKNEMPFMFSRNWWDYLLDPDKAIQFVNGLQ